MKMLEAMLDSKIFWKLPFKMQRRLTNLFAHLFFGGTMMKELFERWWGNGGREKAVAAILNRLSEEGPEAEFE